MTPLPHIPMCGCDKAASTHCTTIFFLLPSFFLSFPLALLNDLFGLTSSFGKPTHFFFFFLKKANRKTKKLILLGKRGAFELVGGEEWVLRGMGGRKKR